MDKLYARIFADAEFQALQQRRQRFTWLLSGLVFGAFLSFLLCVAFAPRLLAAPIGPDSVISRGIPWGSAIIVFGLILTGIYGWRTNGEFDRAMVAIVVRCSAEV